jgi:RNase P subunit RPR2
MESKWCPKCERSLSIGEFAKNTRRGDGLQSYCLTCMRETNNVSNAKRRAEFIAELGGACVRCGFDDPRALQIDHVNGGGIAELRTLSGTKYFAKVRANPGDYQLLCANCNWIKRAEQGEVPGAPQGRIPPASLPEGFKQRGPYRKR